MAQVSEKDVVNLVNNRTQEDDRLEFKSTPWNRDDNGKFELLQDVTGMANALGGYIIIGIGTRKSNGKDVANGFAPVEDSTKLAQYIRDICFQYIDPRITELEIETKIVEYKASKLHTLIVRIPSSSDRPHAFEWHDSTIFVRRYGDHIRQMPVSELGQMLSVRFFPDTQTSQEIVTLSMQVSDFGEQLTSAIGTLMKLHSRPIENNMDPLEQTNSEDVVRIISR